MKYTEMIIYLSSHSIEELASFLNIPRPTLFNFLLKKGYKLHTSDSFPVEEKRGRINALSLLGNDSEFSEDVKLTDLQRQIVHGSLLGDMYIGITSKNSAYLKCEHTWGQISYLKVLYELLRPFSFSAYIDPPQKGFQDYQVGFTGHSSFQFKEFRDKFYTTRVNSSLHLQKNILNVVEDLTDIGLAYWVMDDGKKYGSAFALSIGKKSFYDKSDMDRMCEIINDKFKVDFKVSEEQLGYLLYVTKGSSIIDRIRDYILPDMAYKLKLFPEDCGSFYLKYDWWEEWQKIKINLVHPHFQKNPYSNNYYMSLKGNSLKKYKGALYIQSRVRGFPYPSNDGKNLLESFSRLKVASVRLKDKELLYNNSFNHIPNYFMDHRFKLRVRGRKSPYEIFLDNSELKKTLERQLKDGPALNNSNIRAALSVYRTQAVGQFNVLYAKYFCERYSPAQGIVYDPCAGFGARMVGCVAAGRSYIGVEPSTVTFESLSRLSDWLKLREKCNIELIKGCAEDILVEYCDMALTSPPYFNVEEYSYEPTQSFMKYRIYDQWVANFLYPLLKNTYVALKKNGVFILNIDDVGKYPLLKDSVEIAGRCGYTLEDTFFSGKLRRPASFMSSEPFFILRK